MRKRTRGYGAVVGLAALALAVAACGGSSTAKPGTSPTGTTAGFQGLNPGTGTPKKGGPLNMLGQGDVDFMDPNISYYTIGGLSQRMWIRGLYAYAAIPGKTTLPSPDLATAAPTVSNGGKTYAVTIRSGAMWDTSPARPVTAADALLGLKRSCNPIQPFGGLPDFETLIVGYQAFCASFAQLGSTATVAAIKSFINSNQISGVTVSGQTISYTLVHPASYFGTMLTLDSFDPAPVESLNYIPASAAAQQHVIADGPYSVSRRAAGCCSARDSGSGPRPMPNWPPCGPACPPATCSTWLAWSTSPSTRVSARPGSRPPACRNGKTSSRGTSTTKRSGSRLTTTTRGPPGSASEWTSTGRTGCAATTAFSELPTSL